MGCFGSKEKKPKGGDTKKAQEPAATKTEDKKPAGAAAGGVKKKELGDEHHENIDDHYILGEELGTQKYFDFIQLCSFCSLGLELIPRCFFIILHSYMLSMSLWIQWKHVSFLSSKLCVYLFIAMLRSSDFQYSHVLVKE
jgi:hypothetical protein